MKKFLLFFGALLLGSSVCVAQTTAVTATVVDSDSTVWAGASWTLSFIVGPTQSNPAAYTIGGVSLDPAVSSQTGLANGSGVITFTTYQSTSISPDRSSWNLQICPKASAPCAIYNFSTSTSTLNVSTGVNSVIIAPRFKAISGAYGYNDGEAILQLIPGSTYWNVTTPTSRCYTGSAWGVCSVGGGGSGDLSGTLTPSYYPIATAVHTLGDGAIDYGITDANALTVVNHPKTSSITVKDNGDIDDDASGSYTANSNNGSNITDNSGGSISIAESGNSGVNLLGVGDISAETNILNLEGMLDTPNETYFSYALLPTESLNIGDMNSVRVTGTGTISCDGTFCTSSGANGPFYLHMNLNLFSVSLPCMNANDVANQNGTTFKVNESDTSCTGVVTGDDVNISYGTIINIQALGWGVISTGGIDEEDTSSLGITIANHGPAPTNLTTTTPSLLQGNGSQICTMSTGCTGSLTPPAIIYSVAGTPLPTCNVGATGAEAIVSDATGPSFLGIYAGGGAVFTPVICNGTDWVAY